MKYIFSQVDESALAQQVKDKKEREEHERCRDLAYGMLALIVATVLHLPCQTSILIG